MMISSTPVRVEVALRILEVWHSSPTAQKSELFKLAAKVVEDYLNELPKTTESR